MENEILNEDSMIDEKGYPYDMDPEERKHLEEVEYDVRLKDFILENKSFLKIYPKGL